MRQHIPRIVAIALLGILYGFTAPSTLTDEQRVELASDFAFKKSLLYRPTNLTPKYIREVHPQYKKIDSWISVVGASIAFTDYDGDHVANDIVHLDPRFDRVFITPAEGTGNRFAPIELTVRQLPYQEHQMPPSGVLANDFNEDGQMDILVHFLGRSPVIFYKQGDSFVEGELHSSVQKWFTTTATLADFDGDGHLDVFLGNYFPDNSRLYEKDATDHTQVMQHSMSRGDNGAPNRILLWDGIRDGKAVYKESTTWLEGLHYPNDWTLAVAAADINGDMLPEIYVANDFGPDKLLLNTSTKGKLAFKELKGIKKITDIRSSVLGKDSFKGMGVDFGDINGDGLLDIYVSNIADDYALHESHYAFINTGNLDDMKKGVAPFENESESLGLSRSSWGWEARLCDFNNDGVPEALQGTGFTKGTINRWPELQELATIHDELLAHPEAWPKLDIETNISGQAHLPFFVRHPSGKYFDLSAELGLNELQITRGIATADVNRDGKMDFAVAAQWEDSKLYCNTSKTTNAYLGLNLVFPLQKTHHGVQVDTKLEVPVRYAVGATVTVTLPDGKKQVGFVDGGNGHTGKRSSELHFGLGNVPVHQPLAVEITWRNAHGSIVSKTITLQPGWHTIQLPYSETI